MAERETVELVYVAQRLADDGTVLAEARVPAAALEGMTDDEAREHVAALIPPATPAEEAAAAGGDA